MRDEAIQSLCRLEAPETMDTLCELLLDPGVTDWARWDCARALGEIGNWNALPALEAAAKADPTGRLAQWAREAMARIEG